MSASTWLVPLNVHHSLSLRTVAKNSSQLQNISNSIYALTRSLKSLENSAFEIAGSTNRIQSLLETKEHRESTIASMRMLIFRHQQTCSEAINEKDKLSAIVSCIISENLLHRNWFNLDLFSYASFDEMSKADEILRNSTQMMNSLRRTLSSEEEDIVNKIPDFLIRIDTIQASELKILESLFELFTTDYWYDKYSHPPPRNDIYNSYDKKLEFYKMIRINGSYPGVGLLGDATSEIKRCGAKEFLDNIFFNKIDIERVMKKGSEDPYIWGGILVERYQEHYNNTAFAVKELAAEIKKLKNRQKEVETQSEKLISEMNETFNGRLTVERFMS